MSMNLTLNNGVELPALGFGVFQTPPEETVDAVETALRTGYRHVDTAAAYGNEHEVGEGIRRSGIDRSEVLVETKIWISDYGLIKLVGELSTQSEIFRQRWASHDVQFHRSGHKRLRHPVVGQLGLDFESMELPSEPGLVLNVYTARPDSPTADALKLLASWSATQDLTEESPASTQP